MYRKLILVVWLFAYAGASAQTNTLEKAWEYFANDEFAKSKNTFNELLDSPDKAQAYLGLSLIEAADANLGEQLFENYYNFYLNSENPDFYLTALWSINGGERTNLEVEFLNSVIATKKGYLKAQALQALGYHYWSKGDFDKARGLFATIGAIEKWQLVGDFENISESGFDANFGVLDHPESDYSFINKRGASVKWFDLKAPRYDKWVDFDYHFYIKNSIIYAQTFVFSNIDQEVEYRVGTSGSLKFWANDNLLFSESEERDNGLDTYIFTGKLNKGYNRLLVQIGSSDINNSNFLVRITDNEGGNIPGLEFSTKVEPYTKSTFKSKRLPNNAGVFFKQEIEKNPDHIQNYIILSQMLLRNDKTYEAKKYLLQAREKFPNSSYLLTHLIDLSIRENNRTAMSAYIDELKSRFSDQAISQSILFDEARDLEDYKKCEEILKRMEEVEGLSINVYTRKINLAAARNNQDLMINFIEQAYVKYPDNYQFVYLKALIEKEIKSNTSKAIKILEKYSKNHFNTEALQELSKFYFQTDDVKKGIKQYTTLVELYPIAGGYYNTLSEIYLTMQNYKSAIYYQDKCIEIAPYVGQYYSNLGRIYERQNMIGLAVDNYNKAIEYNPYDYNTNSAIRSAQGKGDIFSTFENDDVYELFENSPSADAFPEDNSLILLDESQNVLHPNGGSELKRKILVKIFNTTGVDDWKQYHITVYDNQKGRIEKAEVLKVNGSKIEAQQNGAELVFESLEPGDAIHIVYKLENYYSGKLSKEFWDKFYFAYFYPIQKSRYSLLVPEGKQFNYQTENFDLEPTIKEVDEGKIYIWEQSDTPSLVREPYMPQLVDYSAILHISTIKDWNFVAEWYADLAYAKTKVNYEIEETVNTLFADKTDLSDLEKAEMIYDYIVNNIRYISVNFIQSGLVPKKASDVINSRQGDCKDVSTLFVSMCKAVGIDANLVLVNSRDNGLRSMALPSIEFNHCIAHTVIDDKPYYLELTDDNLPFSSGYTSVINSFILNIPADRNIPSDASFLVAENRVPNSVRRSADIEFSGENMLVERTNYKTGVNASRMRNWMEDMGEETRLKEMQEAVAGDYPEAKVTALRFINGLYSVNSEIEYEYDYTLPSVFTEISGLSIFKVPFSDYVENLSFLANDDRRSPVELWDVFNAEIFEETVNIKVPAGKTIDIPKSQIYNSPYINYSLSVIKNGSEIKISRKLEVLQDSVPVADFEEFKNQCRNIIKADDLRLAMK